MKSSTSPGPGQDSPNNRHNGHIREPIDIARDTLRAKHFRPDTVAIYIYADEANHPLFGVIRKQDPKTGKKRFHQERWENDQWVGGLGDVRRVPYNLRAIVKADIDQPVYVVEGEKDCDALIARGRLATCNPGGTGMGWKDDYSELLRDRICYVIPDNDEPGREHAQRVAQSLQGKAEIIKLVELPDLPERGDTSDFLAGGGTVDQLDELAHKQPEWTPQEGGFVSFVSDQGEENPKFSGDPRPVAVELIKVPDLDPRMIPEPFRDWLTDIAQRGCFPLEYPAGAAITGISGLLGKRLAVRPKRHDDWLVIPNLWGGVVGPPGIQKTPAVEEALRPLRRLAANAMDQHKQDLEAHNATLMVAEAKAMAAKDRMKKAAKGNATDKELVDLAKEAMVAEDCVEPKLKRYLVNDATVEKLGELLADSPYGLTLFRDELVGFFRTMDKQGHESDRGFFLESWNGFGDYIYDRIGRGTVVIPNVCLSIFGTIQPGPLSRYLRSASVGEEADGLMPRFQVLLYPDPPREFVNVDRYPNADAKSKAFEVFKGIDALNPIAMGCSLDEDRSVPYLGFDSEAQEFFDQWRVDLETRLRSSQENALFTCHLAKYRKLLPALSLIFHVIESQGAIRLQPITLRSLAAAAAWCQLLEAHAKRIYQSALDGDPETAMQLAERIKHSLSNPFTYRDVLRKGWSGLTTADDVQKAVGILEDRNWVKVVEIPTTERGGRPSAKIWINPALRDGDPDGGQS
jgi:hypothetical protein